MDVKFGTSGLRGLSADLLSDVAYRHVAAFCRHLAASGNAPASGEIFVARDRRQSSPELAAQAVAAIASQGMVPVDCGEVPTPALALHAFARGGAAIMITGSHIPADRNGLKFYLPGAEISKADEAGILSCLGDEGAVAHSGVLRDESQEAARNYASRHAGILAPGALAGLKIGVHDHSSIATDGIASALASFGAKVVRFGRSETFVPVDTEAVGAELLALYRAKAAEHGLDAIVSTDADGDRPLLADETGAPIPGDLLGWIAARFTNATAIATPVTSNSAIVSTPERSVLRTKVGSPYVIAAMDDAVASGAKGVAGFEANGGFLLATAATVGAVSLAPLPTRDSMLPLLATLARSTVAGVPLSGLRALESFRFTAADRLQDYAGARSAMLMERLRDPVFRSQFLAGLPQVADEDSTDGLRLSLADASVIHFRPSGNAPEMRCYCEATTGTGAASLLGEGLRRLSEFWA